ncbi:hypothetical protein CKALI_10515 [Corynebacterium kalinowskii]|uniref:Glutaredoxin family protein n=1 Tax=Corynebacterium kalinowskii TaxID=2675216 RepID=A0A6B8VNG3_9CORY|nr:glutaredoxin family protein [Corynebacterium kalinowskii]QGU02954.1 hypothetical protein CKALI_10515 [Corynebacterium kalinowskii]
MLVELMVRATCGSCSRVREQIEPIVRQAGATFDVIDVDETGMAAEFGDRVPVVVVDGEEFACWEVDSDELGERLGLPPALGLL